MFSFKSRSLALIFQGTAYLHPYHQVLSTISQKNDINKTAIVNLAMYWIKFLLRILNTEFSFYTCCIVELSFTAQA